MTVTLERPNRDGVKERMSIEDALRAEADMLARVRSGKARFRFLVWEACKNSLVAPRSMGRQFDGLAPLENDGMWPLHYRSSGGDVTPQGPGIANLSVAFVKSRATSRSIEQTYIALCTPILATLKSLGITAELRNVQRSYCDGAFNIVIDDRKFAGTALRISKSRFDARYDAILAHAVMKLNTDAKSGVEQINSLYLRAGIDKKFDPSVNLSLHSVYKDTGRFLSILAAKTQSHFEYA